MALFDMYMSIKKERKKKRKRQIESKKGTKNGRESEGHLGWANYKNPGKWPFFSFFCKRGILTNQIKLAIRGNLGGYLARGNWVKFPFLVSCN